MALSADMLRPRVPVRLARPQATLRPGQALMQAHATAALPEIVRVLAGRLPDCVGADLQISAVIRLEGDTDRGHSTDRALPDLTTHADGGLQIGVPLALGRARLELRFGREPGPAAVDGLCELIDLLDLRLQELAAGEHLHGALLTARRNENLQHALYALADLSYADIDMPELLGHVHAIISELTYAENFYIVLYDDQHDRMRFVYYADQFDHGVARVGVDLEGKDFPGSPTFALLHRGESMMGSTRELIEALGMPLDERQGHPCVDWLGVPMLSGERVRGAVVVQSYDPARRYSEEDRSLLAFVAQHIHAALVRKQAQDELESEVQRRTRELAEANRVLREEVAERERAQRLQAALFRIAELASARGSLDEFYAGVHQVVSNLLDARNFFIALLSEDRENLHFPYFVDEQDTPAEPRRLGHGKTEYVLRHRRPLLAFPADTERLIERGELEVMGTYAACWLGVPLLLGERAVGVLAVQSYSPERVYTLRDQDVLVFASFHIATALERKQSQERLQHAYGELERRVEERTHELQRTNEELREQIVERQKIESQLKHEALHDALTGLPNRTALLDHLALALRRYHRDRSHLFAVLFLDLDRFKVVNDSVGHLAGDELLVQAGQRIARCLREPDSVARLGGDEFAILLEDVHGVEHAAYVAERVLGALNDPITIGGKEIYTSASIGIALADPSYRGAEELLRDADIAMYRAKAKGRQRFELFDQALHLEALRLLDLGSDLRRALGRGEFEPFFQPIVRLADGMVLGYEALLRWNHPERGLLLPADFLAVAEDSGSLEQIDWQLYEAVCRALPALGDPSRYVGINVSPRHFRSPNLARAMLHLFEQCKVAPSRIRVEVTEGALLENPEQARATMLQLREAGVKTSLDDFGTGYSSLSYLHRFPLQALKIDRSFVAELRPDLSGSSAAVVRAIRALAATLELELIAEGIETTTQREALLQLECEAGQGFLFAQPRRAAELAA